MPRPLVAAPRYVDTRAALDRAASDAFLAGMEQAGQAAAILDAAGLLVASNARADQFLGDAIVVKGGRLVGRSDEVDSRLQRLLRAILNPDTFPGGQNLVVLPRAGGSPLIVRGTRIAAAGPMRRSEILLTFTSTQQSIVPNPALLRAAFGLTATEASVAMEVADGATVHAVARGRGITADTVRSHLKIVFQKTGTRRQASLVALIIKLHMMPSPDL